MDLLKRYLKKYRLEVILAPSFKLLESLFDLLVPLVIANMITAVNGNMEDTVLYKSFFILIVMAVVGLLCSFTAQYLASKAAVYSANEIRMDLYDHLQHLSQKEKDEMGNATLLSYLTTDINQIQSGINMALRLLLRSPFIVFGSTIMALRINRPLTLIFVVVTAILFAIVITIMKISNRMTKTNTSLLDRITSLTKGNLEGVRVIRAFGKEEDEVAEFSELNSRYHQAMDDNGKMTALTSPFTYLVVNGGIIALLYFSVNYLNLSSLNSELVALISYMSQILVELVKLADLIVTISKGLVSSARVENILKIQSSMTYGDETEKEETETVYCLKDVSYQYASAKEDSISHISLEIKEGESLGIIGGTGAGKSTLISLLTRMYDCGEGSIFLYGKPIQSYTKEALNRMVSVCYQKLELFKGTVLSNMKVAKRNADEEEIKKALTMAQADFAMNLNKEIEENGNNLSGGQKQRLAIGRALMKDSSILILDDSFSALDFLTEARLKSCLKELNKTLILCSQRISTLENCSRILVLDDGKMVDLGTHAELLSRCMLYREIYQTQNKEEKA